MIHRITANAPSFVFRAGVEAVARVSAGDRVAIETTDTPYRGMTGDAIEDGDVSFSRVNALTGPIWIEGAEPGDAVGLTIDGIDLGEVAHIVYVARWRRASFGIAKSRVMSYPIANGELTLPEGGKLLVRPMIGCIGVAPATGSVSALSPCAPTGGNMDLVELAPGATIWFPCCVPGALLSLGDLHAGMGRGEPVGCGLECAGVVRGSIQLAKRQTINGPMIVTARCLSFIGSHANDLDQAARLATSAAWAWLRQRPELSETTALAIAAALLDVNLGGPAGANVIASLPLAELRVAGIALSGWPFVMIP